MDNRSLVGLKLKIKCNRKIAKISKIADISFISDKITMHRKNNITPIPYHTIPIIWVSSILSTIPILLTHLYLAVISGFFVSLKMAAN